MQITFGTDRSILKDVCPGEARIKKVTYMLSMGQDCMIDYYQTFNDYYWPGCHVLF